MGRYIRIAPDSLDSPGVPCFAIKACFCGPLTPTQLPPQLTAELELVVQPKKFKGARLKKGSETGELEVLIQWQGTSEAEATWEDYERFKLQFLEFDFEDKVKVWAAGIDKPKPFLVYQRRSRKPKQGTNPI
uniref:Chromo domain-containing protein n=1 Tax=Lactuca sativa TaxID=4236 RepID=A0A9R1WLQ5_LACSA|nr:hypothetical protein LSAT_V11C100008010 [Lactuca sativa]